MTIMDLDAVDASGASGAVWSLPDSDELNANLVVLAPGDKIGRHVNDEVDVLVVVLSGRGVLVADEVVWHLQPHLTVLVPRGAARKITAALADDAADDEPLRYLSIHVARGGLEIRGAANATSAATP
jgi:quercetin dioxygenase-like cupin family protein